MLSTVKQIINMEIQDILKSPEFLIKTLRCYSTLYLNGAPCSTCEKSIKKYHEILKKTGIMKAENNIKKTCECKKTGLIYVAKLGRHIDLSLISDKDALTLINMNIMKKSDFSKLPNSPELKNKEKTNKSDNTGNKKTVKK